MAVIATVTCHVISQHPSTAHPASVRTIVSVCHRHHKCDLARDLAAPGRAQPASVRTTPSEITEITPMTLHVTLQTVQQATSSRTNMYGSVQDAGAAALQAAVAAASRAPVRHFSHYTSLHVTLRPFSHFTSIHVASHHFICSSIMCFGTSLQASFKLLSSKASFSCACEESAME